MIYTVIKNFVRFSGKGQLQNMLWCCSITAFCRVGLSAEKRWRLPKAVFLNVCTVPEILTPVFYIRFLCFVKSKKRIQRNIFLKYYITNIQGTEHKLKKDCLPRPPFSCKRSDLDLGGNGLNTSILERESYIQEIYGFMRT